MTVTWGMHVPSGRLAQQPMPLRFDGVGGRVPGYGGLAEIGFVGHVASQRGVVAEDGVFGDLLVDLHALEQSPEVRIRFVAAADAAADAHTDPLFARHGVEL